MKLVRLFLAQLALGVFGALVAASAWAWPDKPIEIVVGFAPGGGTDITARTLATYLGKALGGTVLVVNKPGASGGIGLAYVARAQADGYTLGMTNMPGLLTLPIERDAGFKAGDFTYIANLVRDPSAFSVTLDSPYKTLADLTAAAKKAPGAVERHVEQLGPGQAFEHHHRQVIVGAHAGGAVADGARRLFRRGGEIGQGLVRAV